ncbi:MAG: tRNA (N(6)-L-threonylcarbamoyladenosine(37)-C(2))-methylthiotransferase [Candidatus Lokiarchaeota archaeon]|nr:tRNA (N(6)-L-threonylcarbamoyladenosine(37)-C(2))-methylthiotransferase [Candidatus Lokiarchaeota archaeon]
MNIAESEMIEGILVERGYELTEDPKKADLLLFNSCFVKSPTESKLISKIRKYIKQFPNKKMIISGCMPEVRSSYLEKIFPSISMIGTSAIKQIPKYIEKIFQGEKIQAINQTRPIKLGFPRILKNEVIGIIPIAEGCNHKCSFCCTKLARGEIYSYPASQILKEIKNLLDKGCKEFWITGQDVSAYYNDILRLPDLLKEINKINASFFYRIGMMNPSNLKKILPNYLRTLNEDKMYKFVHLPLQSGSNHILKLMDRSYSINDFLKIIEKIRNVTKISLATDVIVGFPGEINDHFNETLEKIAIIKPDIVNISQFGARPKTPAIKLENKVHSEIIKERSRKLTKFCEEIIKNRNEDWINWEGSILISEKGKKNGFIGRNFCYKPVLIKDKNLNLGQIINIIVTSVGKGYLIGSVIK